MLAGSKAVAYDLGHLFDFGLGIHDIDALARMLDQRRLVVVLVLDVADDHFNDVFQ
jgi:hypothetical protein